MQQPDRETLRILQQRGTPPEGVTLLRADLGAFFADIARVGRDPALLLLTIRALRQRAGARLRVEDLMWVLASRRRSVLGWLERLSAAGMLVYDATNGTLDVELSETAPPTWTDVHPPNLSVRHDLPTHWFIHLLPRIGRRAFVAYLYLLHRDGTSAPATLEIPGLTRTARLPSRLHARWTLRHLRRAGLIVPDAAHNALIVTDPRPLTPAERRRLRRRKFGRWITARWLALAVVTIAALLVLAVATVRTR